MEPELEVKKAKKVELKLKNKYFWLHNTMIFYSSCYEYLCYSGKTKNWGLGQYIYISSSKDIA